MKFPLQFHWLWLLPFLKFHYKLYTVTATLAQSVSLMLTVHSLLPSKDLLADYECSCPHGYRGKNCSSLEDEGGYWLNFLHKN